MASIPVYGSQLIRFAETFPAVGTATVRAHRVVGVDQDAAGGAVLIEMGEAAGANFTPVGVNQFEILASSDTSAAQGPRVASVATSGLLLIEVSPEEAPVAGGALNVDDEGRARGIGGGETDGTEYFSVTINGVTPTVREVAGDFALVSFS